MQEAKQSRLERKYPTDLPTLETATYQKNKEISSTESGELRSQGRDINLQQEKVGTKVWGLEDCRGT